MDTVLARLRPRSAGASVVRGWAFVALGGFALLPYLQAVVAIAERVPDDVPRAPLTVVVLAVAALPPLVVAATPPVRGLLVAVVRALRPGVLPTGPMDRAPGRTAAWTVLHLTVGAVACSFPFVVGPVALELLRASADAGATLPRILAPVAGLFLLVAVVTSGPLLARALDRAAPGLLGPGAEARAAAAEARVAELEARNALARDLHDTVGHALTASTVQAGAARRLLDRDPGFVAEALDAIERVGRRALEDLDVALGHLRADRPADAFFEVLVGPGVEALEELVRAAGPTVRLEREGPAPRLAGDASAALYRAAQEGVTNALRHGEAEGAVVVRLRSDRAGAVIEVTSRGTHQGPSRPGGGHGLAGLRERLAHAGGQVDAGPVGDGTWCLRARVGTARW